MPAGSTESSKAACGEWLLGAVSGSRPSTSAPRKSIAPGTSASTREKSSLPVIGLGIRSAAPGAEQVLGDAEGERGLGRRR